MEQALQWWCDQQSKQLNREAQEIRDRLLQESFVVRRSLELAQLKSNQLFNYSDRKWIERFEIFHSCLKELSDRLSPPYLEEGLPLAIEYLIDRWRIAQPTCEFQWQFTPQWQQNLSQRNRIVLTSLDELLKLEIAECIKKEFVFIDLRQNQGDNQLKIKIKSPQYDATNSSDKCRELEYLKQSFRVLTSGIWETTNNELATMHCLRWCSLPK